MTLWKLVVMLCVATLVNLLAIGPTEERGAKVWDHNTVKLLDPGDVLKGRERVKDMPAPVDDVDERVPTPADIAKQLRKLQDR